MNKLIGNIKMLAAAAVIVLMSACSENDVDAPNDNVDFVMGADVSWLTEMESTGLSFRDSLGTKAECLALLKSYGITAVRLRVWVDPYEHGGWCSSDDVLHKALRAKRLGMDVMIDFHYSDWWADPGRQNIPHAWSGHSYVDMMNDVAEHTKEVLYLLKSNGVVPKWVQVGNETSNGLLWPVGQADLHPEQYAGLFKSGYDAVKEVFPDADVIVHLNSGANGAMHRWNLNLLRDHGARWDVIGLSVYPYWDMLAGENSSADEVLVRSRNNIIDLSRTYDCDVMVVETGMCCADDNGKVLPLDMLFESKRQLKRLINLCRDSTEGRCRGVFYWEPECRPSKYRLGAFDAYGRPTVIMDAFAE